ncbi:hypothetical protein [Paraglaciecola aestuariivivens]
MQYIRNSKGQAIGMQQTLSNGIKQVYSVNPSRLVGWYDPSSDKTINAKTGNWMGYGDQTIMLLADSI